MIEIHNQPEPEQPLEVPAEQLPPQLPTPESLQQQGIQPMKKNPRGRIYCLTIIGQIEGHMLLPPTSKTTKYEHVIPQLVAVADDAEIEGILIILNTVGGDVEAGLAISEMIQSIGKPTVSLVLGGGHSIGVPLAVASKYSFIAPTATMTIHPIRMNGTVVGVPQTYEYFDKMQERILEFVALNSKISKNRFKQLMLDTGKLARDVGTILIGQEAVDEKLIDEIGGVDKALDKLYEMVEQARKHKKKALKKQEKDTQ